MSNYKTTRDEMITYAAIVEKATKRILCVDFADQVMNTVEKIDATAGSLFVVNIGENSSAYYNYADGVEMVIDHVIEDYAVKYFARIA